MLTDEEHVAANSGRGIDIAEYRIAAAKVDPQALSGVAHLLAAAEAMSLHLRLMEGRAQFFRRELLMVSGGPTLPKVIAGPSID